MLEFETYVRNYRREVIEPVLCDEQISIGKIMIAQTQTCEGDAYHRATILSGGWSGRVCRVSELGYY